jgi:GNAT acetyltransferase-like protein
VTTPLSRRSTESKAPVTPAASSSTDMHVMPYDTSSRAAWEDLAARARMATFLHTRAFLDYHDDRFEDASATLYNDDGVLVGFLPAAADPAEPACVASHPGATFGGLIHDGALRGPATLEALTLLCAHYRASGYERLRYAAVPFIYHCQPSADDLYALFRLGALRARCNLSTAIDLEEGARLSSRRRRGLAKARRAGVEVTEGADLLEELWPIVETNLSERHGARPVHTAGEMRMLTGLFGDDVAIVTARHGGQPVAGVVLFDSPRVSHVQYIASLPAGNDVGALDAAFDHCLERARGRGARFFDFGTSNQDGGRKLNHGLYAFKAQFGGGGVAYETYELELGAA